MLRPCCDVTDMARFQTRRERERKGRVGIDCGAPRFLLAICSSGDCVRTHTHSQLFLLAVALHSLYTGNTHTAMDVYLGARRFDWGGLRRRKMAAISFFKNNRMAPPAIQVKLKKLWGWHSKKGILLLLQIDINKINNGGRNTRPWWKQRNVKCPTDRNGLSSVSDY